MSDRRTTAAVDLERRLAVRLAAYEKAFAEYQASRPHDLRGAREHALATLAEMDRNEHDAKVTDAGRRYAEAWAKGAYPDGEKK